ncbi:hypothetical protein ACP6JC_007415 [Aspergillus fumigatus]
MFALMEYLVPAVASRTGERPTLEMTRSADDAQGAEEEEEEPSQKTIASMSYEEVEDWDGEDCVDGAGSGREGVGHCASRFRQMYILRAIYLAEESAKSGRQRQ